MYAVRSTFYIRMQKKIIRHEFNGIWLSHDENLQKKNAFYIRSRLRARNTVPSKNISRSKVDDSILFERIDNMVSPLHRS